MNLPRPSVANGASLVPRSLSWKLKPAAPVRYQRSSKSCAEAAWAKARPPSSAAVRIFLFIYTTPCFGGMKPIEAWSSTATSSSYSRTAVSAHHRGAHYARSREGHVNSRITIDAVMGSPRIGHGATLYSFIKPHKTVMASAFQRFPALQYPGRAESLELRGPDSRVSGS